MSSANFANVNFSKIEWLTALNVGGSTIPPFGLCEVQATDANGILLVSVPTNNDADCMICGLTQIPIGAYGSVTRHEPFFAMYDPYTNNPPTPAAQQEWGAAAGSYFLTWGQTGFLTLGPAFPTEASGGYPRVMVVRSPVPDNGHGGGGGGGCGCCYCSNGQASSGIYAYLRTYQPGTGESPGQYSWWQAYPQYDGSFLYSAGSGLSGAPNNYPGIDLNDSYTSYGYGGGTSGDGGDDVSNSGSGILQNNRLPLGSIASMVPACYGPYWIILDDTARPYNGSPPSGYTGPLNVGESDGYHTMQYKNGQLMQNGPVFYPIVI